MKKILCFILILMFTIIPVADAEGFIDVDSSYSWAVDAITELSNMGIINGYPDGTFKPENNIKNAETSKITVLVFGKSENEITYKDVLEDKWYYSYVKDSGNYFLRDESFMPDAGICRIPKACSRMSLVRRSVCFMVTVMLSTVITEVRIRINSRSCPKKAARSCT